VRLDDLYTDTDMDTVTVQGDEMQYKHLVKGKPLVKNTVVLLKRSYSANYTVYSAHCKVYRTHLGICSQLNIWHAI
jgi:hypothetical protein